MFYAEMEAGLGGATLCGCGTGVGGRWAECSQGCVLGAVGTELGDPPTLCGRRHRAAKCFWP